MSQVFWFNCQSSDNTVVGETSHQAEAPLPDLEKGQDVLPKKHQVKFEEHKEDIWLDTFLVVARKLSNVMCKSKLVICDKCSLLSTIL